MPLAELPGEAEDSGETEINDEDVPLAELPEDDLTEIEDSDVPLADVPKTGDNSQVWEVLALISGAGLAWLVLENKKRRMTE